MKLIESSFTILEEQDPFKAIELAGRTCYKSEDKITEDSAKAFVDMLIKRGHGAMLEHGTVYLKDVAWNGSPLEKYKWNMYSRYKDEYLGKEEIEDGNDYDVDYKYAHYVTTNYRVLVENGWLDDLKYICEPTEHHERRISVRFICDRGVSHELVRHRVFSFAQESTRFCNYSKEKFGNELTFIRPSWLGPDNEALGVFYESLKLAEEGYFTLLAQWDSRHPDRRYKTKFRGNPLQPQQARQVLPNALKTELVMTGFASQWEAAFKLRCAENAHPDCRKLMVPLKEEFIKRGYINEQ